MGSLKELLEAKRELKTLGEIAIEIYRGSEVTNSQIGTGNYPCTTFGSISNAFSVWFDKCNFQVNPDLIKNPKFFEKGDLLVVTSSQIIRCVGDCCAYLGEEKGIAGAALFVVKHNQNPKYLSYALSTNNSKKQKQRFILAGAINNINTSGIKKLKIPIPSLEIQKQISEFLDLLRELVRELVRELSNELLLRKKQYSYYLNQLIRKDLGNLIPLEEISTEIYRGVEVTNAQIGTGNYPCTTFGSISNAFSVWFEKCNFGIDLSLIKKPKFFEYGDLLIVTDSQVIRCVGDCCTYLGVEKGVAGSHICVVKHNQNPKYLSYVFSSQFLRKQIEYMTNGGAVYGIKSSNIKKLKIPLLPLNIQEQIANTLDQFRELSEDLEKGIPKEIEMWKKVYEYYRDLLIDGVN